MSNLRWYLRQLIPTEYRTRYRIGDVNGPKHFCVWWMWLGRSFAIDDVATGG